MQASGKNCVHLFISLTNQILHCSWNRTMRFVIESTLHICVIGPTLAASTNMVVLILKQFTQTFSFCSFFFFFPLQKKMEIYFIPIAQLLKRLFKGEEKK